MYIESQNKSKKRRVVVVTTHYGIFRYLSEIKEYENIPIMVVEKVPELIEGDIVIGALPPSLVYEICIQEGVEYRELVIDKSRQKRRPLSYNELIMYDIKIIPLRVHKNNNQYYLNFKYNKKVILITRHKATIEWLEDNGLLQDNVEIYSVLNKEILNKIDKNTIIIGILPLYLIHEVNKRGAVFFAIEMIIHPLKWKRNHSELKKEEFRIRLSSYTVMLN